jgi:tetratricopeptide (TPR) repeat protein
MRSVAVVVVLLGVAGWAPSAQGENRAQAKAYFNAGVIAYDQGKYEVALREFQHAHALSHSAPLYFNMAACEEHMDHFQAAALLLRQYLIEKPDADDRSNVETRIRSLEERDESRRRAVAPAPAPAPAPVMAVPVLPTTTAPPPPPPPRARLKYTWVLLGVTAAVGVTAIGVGAYTVKHHGDLESGCGATAGGCSASDISGLRSTAVATDVLIGVTAAAAVATVVVAVVESRRGRTHAAAPRRLAMVSF